MGVVTLAWLVSWSHPSARLLPLAVVAVIVPSERPMCQTIRGRRAEPTDRKIGDPSLARRPPHGHKPSSKLMFGAEAALLTGTRVRNKSANLLCQAPGPGLPDDAGQLKWRTE